MDNEMLWLGYEIANELRASSPYKTGNMRNSIALVQIDSDFLDIVIAVDYASYVNQKGKHQGWIESVVSRVCETYASNNNVEGLQNLTGIITYGGN